MKLSNIIKDWKSSVLATVLLVGLGFAVAYDKVSGASEILLLLTSILPLYGINLFNRGAVKDE